MKYLSRICLFLLLITAAVFGDSNNVVQEGTVIISNSTINFNAAVSNNQTNANRDSEAFNDDVDADDDTSYYVCGSNDIEKKCTCTDTTLSCISGYNVDTLTNIKIKVQNENFTAKFVNFHYNILHVLKRNEILPGHESTIEEMNLASNSIETIEDGAFDKFTSLKKLNLGHNFLKSLNGTFLTKQLGSTLEELDLNGNNLQNLITNVFQHLTKLRELNLAMNRNINLVSKLNGIYVTIFPEALSNLTSLNLEFCNIQHFDDNVFINLRNLETLEISNNPISSVPKAIKVLSNLKHLYMDSNAIISIDDCDLCNLPKLKTFHLRWSALENIDENAFGALSNESTVPQLDEFSVRFCRVAVLPEKLLDWKNVSRIDIDLNDLACNCSMAWLINDYNASKPLYVDKLIDRLGSSNKNKLKCYLPSTLYGTHLHTLGGNFCKNDTVLDKNDDEDVYYVCGENDVVGEEDTKIYKGCSCSYRNLYCSNAYHSYYYPQHKLNHTNIQVLNTNFPIESADLTSNNITSLKKGKILPGNEHTVRNLDLGSNKISYIENGTFEKFTVLFELTLNDNNLTNIDTMIFSSTLKRLYLRKTNLDHIPTNSLLNLTLLSLSENPKIFSSSKTIIFPKSFTKLEILGLHTCNITTLDENAFANLQSLKVLFIGNNPFNTIPTAINVLQNLQYLNLDDFNVTVLKNDSLNLKNLQRLTAENSKLQRIDDCAFCSLKNLSRLDLSKSSNFSYIHENAFGGITNKKPIQLQKFSIRYCNISVLPEKLLDWKTVSTIDIQDNPLTCNCSLAWLINDYNASKPLYIHNLQLSWWFNKNYLVDIPDPKLYCTNPPELRYQHLNKLSGDFCLNETNAVKEKEEEKIYRVCGDNNEAEINCACDIYNLYCNSVNTTNIEIISNKSININTINIVYGNITRLDLKKLVPQNQHIIENLNLYQNKISSIENRTFDNFTSLKMLELSYNNLSNIDENILTENIGSTLIELNLGMNNLGPFTSKTFIHLSKLATLSIQSNPRIGNSLSLKILSSSLASLRRLFLEGCNISSLSDDVFINLRNLTYLDLSSNPFTTFPTSINALPNLRMLVISNTGITVMSKKNLKVNKNLKSLYATQSKIQKIEDCAFCSFPNLSHIDLDRNENLSYIHENAFGFAHSHVSPSLALLLMDECNLTTLPEKLLNWTSVHFHASRNPFICDCPMNWYIKLVKSKFIPSHHPYYQCHGPAEFVGKSFYELPDSFCNESTTTTTASTTSTLPSFVTVTDASATSIHSYRQLIVLILSVFIIAGMATVAVGVGVYYHRSRRVVQIHQNREEGDEDLLEEDFDVENV